ncbi:MAG: GNAT family N-acetyltransferase [Defluviimonas sp.]|uniref:GNAT family N-acetyltransferase n=1 Tax=Albidovulum sp. TaxID=1872424 RepID=UPI002A3350BA|nr:GNAT family N-acetyltransferase [Defluviimonas sp.]
MIHATPHAVSLKADWIHGWSAAAGLRDDWRALHRAPDTFGAHLFNDFAFLDIWQSHFGAGKDLVVLSVREADGRLSGLAPLQIETSVRGPVSLRRLGFMHNGFISRVSALMRGDVAAIARAMADALAAHASSFDDMVCDQMLAECPAQIALRAALADAGFLTFETPGDRALRLVDFAGTEDDFVQKSPKANRQNFNRAIRRCKALPDFKVTVTTDATRSRNLHRRLFSLDWLSGKSDRPGAIYPIEGKQFHTELGEQAERVGGVEFVEAWSEGKLVASIVSIVNRRIKYLYVTYYDDAFREQSPGLLVVLRAIGTGLEDPDIDLVDLNGDSELLRRISNARIDRVLFKANHRRGRSFAIGLARKAKRRIT